MSGAQFVISAIAVLIVALIAWRVWDQHDDK